MKPTRARHRTVRERPPLADRDPPLPGLEAIREESRQMPEVAEVPFSLSPPPETPAISPRTGTLFTDLLREEGILLFDVPRNDR